MLYIKNLTKTFGKRVVLKNISTTFGDTGISIIVGINGSGKTTLLNSITSLVRVDSGIIQIDHFNKTDRQYKQKMFYIPSDFLLPEYMTGKEYHKLIMKQYQDYDYKLYKTLISLFDFAGPIDKLIESYSYGMKKKLQIIIGLSLNVKYVITDELLNGVDLETLLLTQKLIENLSRIRKFIMVSHNLNFINEHPHDIRLISDGTLTNFTNVTNFKSIIIKKGILDEKFNQVEEYFNNSKII